MPRTVSTTAAIIMISKTPNMTGTMASKSKGYAGSLPPNTVKP
jgi:hypothetical protein